MWEEERWPHESPLSVLLQLVCSYPCMFELEGVEADEGLKLEAYPGFPLPGRQRETQGRSCREHRGGFLSLLCPQGAFARAFPVEGGEKGKFEMGSNAFCFEFDFLTTCTQNHSGALPRCSNCLLRVQPKCSGVHGYNL